jgi:hypothetical protein
LGQLSLVFYSLELIMVEVTRKLGAFLMLSEINSSSFSNLSVDIVLITSYSTKIMFARVTFFLNSTISTSLSLLEATLDRTYAKIAFILHNIQQKQVKPQLLPYRYGIK